MQQRKELNNQEIISMEEYLIRRQEIRARERRQEARRMQRAHEKNSELMLAGLYM